MGGCTDLQSLVNAWIMSTHLVEFVLMQLVMQCIPEHHCLTSQPSVAYNCTAAASCLLSTPCGIAS